MVQILQHVAALTEGSWLQAEGPHHVLYREANVVSMSNLAMFIVPKQDQAITRRGVDLPRADNFIRPSHNRAQGCV